MYNTINLNFIETAQLALSDQAVLAEFKNHYASVAQDPNARTTDGMKSFAMEWINAFIDNNPDFKDVSESEIHIVEWWIINKILFPITLRIEMTQEARLEASLKKKRESNAQLLQFKKH